MVDRNPNLPKMTSRQAAREALVKWAGQFQQRRNTRLVFMGDGRGYSASNIEDPNKSGHVLVRPNLKESRGYFSVKNKRVTPEFNKPVLLGYLDEEPEEEQVLTVNDVSLEWTASGIDVIQKSQQTVHHKTHEWGGADTVFTDGRQFLPGLVSPTNPPSMQVQIQPFTFFYKEWNSYAGGISTNMTTYKPASGLRYVLISFDPEAVGLQYSVGNIFTGGFNEIVGGMTNVPSPTGDSYPLGIILLKPTTTTVDWNQYGVANLRDARLHINIPMVNILSRLEEVENTLGLDHNATTTGAGASASGDLLTNAGLLRGVNILDISPTEGQFLKYDINSNSWRPASAPSGSGSGEANTITNIGTGIGVYKEKVGVNFQLKTLVAGTNVTLASAASTITINSASTSGEANTGENLGSGISIFREKTGLNLLFKSLSPGNFVTLTSGTSEITIGTEAREESFTFTVGASNTWNNELIPIWRGPRNTSATILGIYPTTSGGGELQFNLQRRDAITVPGVDIFAASQNATSDSSAKTPFATSTIGPLNYLMFTTGSGAESGSVTHITATIYYRQST